MSLMDTIGGFPFAKMVNNLVSELSGASTFLQIVTYVIGLSTFMSGFLLAYKSARGARPNNAPGLAWAWSMVIGVLIMALPTVMAGASQTIFGASHSPLDYMSPKSDGTLSKNIFMLLHIIGYVAFLRGLLMFRRVRVHGASEQTTAGRALTFVSAGTLLVNMDMTLSVFESITGLKMGAFL